MVLCFLKRILQLLQGLVVDGAQAVVDKSAAQKHSQGKDPGVILRVTLQSTFKQEFQDFALQKFIHTLILSVFHLLLQLTYLPFKEITLKTDINTDVNFDNSKDIPVIVIFFISTKIRIFTELSFSSVGENKGMYRKTSTLPGMQLGTQ